jgi:hypothetical protein
MKGFDDIAHETLFVHINGQNVHYLPFFYAEVLHMCSKCRYFAPPKNETLSNSFRRT